MHKTYIQEKADGGAWRLTVQVTEKASDSHREVIQTIYNAMMQGMAIGKVQALALRKDILQWH